MNSSLLSLNPLTSLDFFQKHRVAVMTVRELFEFVTDPSITSDNINQYLEKVCRFTVTPVLTCVFMNTHKHTNQFYVCFSKPIVICDSDIVHYIYYM